MATTNQNLSIFDIDSLGDCSSLRIGIVSSEWNGEVTDALLKGAKETLGKAGVSESNIHIIKVPGSFELVAGGRLIASQHGLDAVICLGCVVQGETRHFDFICQAVATGLAELNVISGIPFIFGVLTTDNQQQALERAGGKHGNKGAEAAYTALRMGLLKKKSGKDKDIGFKK